MIPKIPNEPLVYNSGVSWLARCDNCDWTSDAHMSKVGAIQGLSAHKKECKMEEPKFLITDKMREDLATTLIACGIAVENPPPGWDDESTGATRQFLRAAELAVELAWSTLPAGGRSRLKEPASGMAAGWEAMGLNDFVPDEQDTPNKPAPMQRLRDIIKEDK